MAKSCEYEIVYLSHFWLYGFYSPSIHFLNEYLHLWDLEPLVINVGFLLPVNDYSSISIRTLLLSCLLHLISFMACPSLLTDHYNLH